MNNNFLTLGEDKLFFDEPMCNHTSFKIGGKADIVFLPETPEDIVECIKICETHNIPYYVIGNGTNLLVSDNGFRGVIIKTARLNKITEIKNGHFYVGAGVNMPDLSDYFLEHSYTGFEFACGIPGTVGGGVFMNAGAYTKEMGDIVISVDLLDNGKITTLSNEEMEFGYRSSVVKGTNMAILGATFLPEKGEYNEIKEKIDHLTAQRKHKQPLEIPNAGSTFRRPKGNFAGQLIQNSGMVGQKVGGAMVSEKHAGFIINIGCATSEDVLALISKIKKAVKEQFDVELEEELIHIGE